MSPGERHEDLASYEYARQLFDRQREYIDELEDQLIAKIEKHNDHRRAAYEMIDKTVSEHEAELSTKEGKPGWVHKRLSMLELSQEATAETIKWMNRLLILTLLGLAANLVVLVLKG